MPDQNKYSKKLINGKNIPYYSLARVGDYTFSPIFVAFRDNSKNCAVVVENIETPWGELKRPAFQNHAVTITQRPNGEYISGEEAYYIAGIINCDVVTNFVHASSDGRSLPINPRYQIPLYDENSEITDLQLKIAELSKMAHRYWDDDTTVNNIKNKISKIYITMLKKLKD